MKDINFEEFFEDLDLKIKEIVPSCNGWGKDPRCVESKRINLEDFGFCKDGEPDEEDKKVLGKYDSWIRDNIKPKEIKEECDATLEAAIEGALPIIKVSRKDEKFYVNGIEVPEEIWKARDEVYKKIYSQFVYPAPGYVERTLEHAKKHNYIFPEPIPEGSTIVITYPLSHPVVFETKVPLKDSYDLMRFFCNSYNLTYTIEDETTENEPGLIPGMYNRNKTSGVFGIWGHEIGDLVLEGLIFDKLDDGKIKILPIMGS